MLLDLFNIEPGGFESEVCVTNKSDHHRDAAPAGQKTGEDCRHHRCGRHQHDKCIDTHFLAVKDNWRDHCRNGDHHDHVGDVRAHNVAHGYAREARHVGVD
jgi:hypothetical protein